jgi:hypothetical protein
VAEGRKAWWDGLTKGECRVCGAPAHNPRAFYCEEHLSDQAKAKKRRPTEGGKSKESKPGGLLARFTKSGGDAGAKEGRPSASGERRPSAPKARRVAAQDFWGDLVEGGASVVGRAGYVPMARSMVWSSPVAGEIIEDATKGTVVDRLIQPVCRNAEKWQDLFDLLGLWGAVGVAQANPAQSQQALGFARKRLLNLLPRIAENIKKQRAKEKAAAEALIEVMPDLAEMFPDAPADADPLDLLMQMLFAAPPVEVAEAVI